MRFELPQKVQAVNTANKYGIERVYPEMLAALLPFTGKAVFKVTGGYFQKVANVLPEFDHRYNLNVTRYNSDYSIMYQVFASVQVPNTTHTVSHTASVYVAKLSNGAITEFYDPPDFRCDYDVEQVKNQIVEYNRLKELAERAKSGLHNFEAYL